MRMPGIAVELALDPGEAARYVGLQGGPRYVLPGLAYDDHVVIPFYVALLLGIWLFGRGIPFARALGILVIAVALFAGYSDRQENRWLRQITAEYQKAPGGGQILQDTVDDMREWSLHKWGLLAAAMALLSVPFFARRRSLPVALVYLASAVAYLIGLGGHGAGLRALVEWGLYLVGLAWRGTFAGIGAVPARVRS
jgi:hypothetical protein